MANFLHGIEILEIDSGGRTITTPSTSVIGIVGTAPSATGDALPINKPVLITKVQDLVTLGIGETGTIPSALRSVYNQSSAICVVVRVEEGADQTSTLVNLAGDAASYSGVYALMLAEEELKVKPKLLLCPYFSGVSEADNKPNSIVNNLTDVADKLRAVAIIDAPNTTKQDAITFASNVGSARAYIVDPAYTPAFAVGEGEAPYVASSSLVAGVLAKNDAEKGFWWSPSNTEVKGVAGLSRPISFGLSDATCDANLLNEAGVGTIIFSGGAFRIWGNRSPSVDNKWHFVSVRRTVDTVYDSIEANMMWALDRPFNLSLLTAIEMKLQSYLNILKSKGALLGAEVWVDKEANNAETYSQGQLIVDFKLEPVAPLERLTFRAYRGLEYAEELFK